jgi:hypothetical protein
MYAPRLSATDVSALVQLLERAQRAFVGMERKVLIFSTRRAASSRRPRHPRR